MVRSARSFQRDADQLRTRGWTYRQIAAHWRERYRLNSRVAFRLAHGLTQADVARRWNEEWPDVDTPKTAKQISYWEIWPEPAGRAPSLDTLNRLAFLYRCSAGELLDGQDHSHLDPMQAVAAGGSSGDGLPVPDTMTDIPITRVNDRVISDFELMTDAYRQVDYRAGSGRVRSDVVRHLRRMLAVSDRTTGISSRHRLLRAAGDAAQLAAWLAMDAQKYPEAHGYCKLVVSLAEKSNDRALHAYGLGVLGWIYLHDGNGQVALNVLDTARELAGRGRVPAAVDSWLQEAAGEAYGLLGQSRRGLTALAEAERVFDGVTAGNTPGWLAFFNADCHAARLKGRCLTRLHRPTEATRALYEALTLLPSGFVRERSGTLIDLADAYVQLRQVEQACDVAYQADVLARQTASERNRKRLRELLVELMPWAGLDCVQRLHRQVLLN